MNIFETNNKFYNEWFGMEYNEIKKNLSEFKLNNLYEAKTFFISYSNNFQIYLNKFLNIQILNFVKN